jgi:hypothetical protein
MENIRQLSQSLQQRAIEDLNEVPDSIPDELRELKSLIQQTPYLRARTDNQFLLTFLRGSKHDVQIALRKIEMFYECRAALPQIMTDRDPLNPKIREIIKLG